MKNLNQKATKVFMLLVDGLKEPGDAKKIDNTNGAFMTVHVELIHQNEHGRHYSIAHYYEQNGDLMRDPDVVFLLSAIDNQVYPLTFRQDGCPQVDQVAATANDSESICFNHKVQADITDFANMWMKNICEQQGLKGDGDGRAIVV